MRGSSRPGGPPRSASCARCWRTSAIYYALWAVADVLILAGRDVGWALRIVPNQLYYAFWVPVVWWLFFSPRYASTRSLVQARR